MSDAPERPQDEQQRQARGESQPREESVLPVAGGNLSGNRVEIPAGIPAAHTTDFAAKRRTTLRVVGGTIVVSIAISAILEYAGWQIAFMDLPTPHAPIPGLAFLRGVWDTTLGAVGIGAAGALAALLLPSTWRNAWRRVPAAFALGAAAFLGFLSFVTLGFFR